MSGVRKHARKTHTAWLKSVDEASLTRDRETESKPSTYCVMEVDDQKTFDGHNPSMQLMQCRDLYDESMPAHLRQASFAAATAISLSLHSGSSLLHPRMSHHPSILGCGLTPVNTSRQTLQRDFAQTESLARLSSGCPPDCCCSRPWSSESAAPPRMLPPLPELSQEFNQHMPQTEVMTQKRPSPTFELDDPLCQTPPMAPSTLGNDNKCLSPFELEEKRPSKLARVGNVPLKPEPVRFPGEPPSYASGHAFCDRDAPSVMPVNEVRRAPPPRVLRFSVPRLRPLFSAGGLL